MKLPFRTRIRRQTLWLAAAAILAASGCGALARLGHGALDIDAEGGVTEFTEKPSGDGRWINGGYFVFTRKIFDYIRDGEELVIEPFNRLIDERLLVAYRHEGFFRPMDTLRDKQALDDMVDHANMPWRLQEQSTR